MSTIESVLNENRLFAPPPDFVKQRQRLRHGRLSGPVRRGAGRLRRLLGAARARARALAQAVSARAGREQCAVLQVVPRRRAQRLLQLSGPASRDPAEQGRHHLRGRRRLGHQDHLPAALPPRLPVRQRAEVARHQDRRPGDHLPADEHRGGGGDAGLRPHRRHSLGGVRRVLGQEPAGAHRRRRCRCRHHGRRPDARRPRDRAQACRRRGLRHGRLRRRQERGGLQAHRQRYPHARAARRLVGRRHPGSGGRVRADLGRTPSTRCSSSTPRAPPASRKACSTRAAGTSCMRCSPCCGRSTTSRPTCSGAPPTWAG